MFVRPRQLAYERRFDEAIAQIQACISFSSKPGAPLAGDRIINLTLLGYYQEWAGRSAEARNTFLGVIEAIKPSANAIVPVTSKRLPCYLALAYAGAGEKEQALAQAPRAVEEYRQDALDAPIAAQTLAQIQARFGDADAAIAALPPLLEVPAGLTPGLLRIDPFWDPLRSDPRFEKIVSAAK
jgi:tetratricopeptide (TPR) repeat protein